MIKVYTSEKFAIFFPYYKKRNLLTFEASLVALPQPIARLDCSNKGNLDKVPGGSSQGTLWTLLDSWFRDRLNGG